jgi:SPP1 gp7 family putative phage head morphogenesis protein
MPNPPDILKASTRFKLQLLRENDKALREMARTYAAVWKKLKPQFDQLTKQIEEARRLNQKVKPSWIFRQQRYRLLMNQAEAEIMRFGKFASGAIGDQQRKALTLGVNHSTELMQLSLGPAPQEVVRAGYRVSWARIPKEALQNIVGVLADGSPLSYKFKGMPQEIAQGVKDVISTGIAQGQNPRVMAREIRKQFDGALSNALTTCRTETMRAYRTASHENYRANSDVCSGWVWLASESPRTCPACWSRHGSFHTLDEDLIDHVRGRCSPAPVCRGWQDLYPDLDMSGIKDTSAKPFDPTESFNKMNRVDKLRVLGPTRLKMLESGEITLRDLATTQKSDKWGDSIRPKNLKELKENKPVE